MFNPFLKTRGAYQKLASGSMFDVFFRWVFRIFEHLQANGYCIKLQTNCVFKLYKYQLGGFVNIVIRLFVILTPCMKYDYAFHFDPSLKE
jgi:hypothetical protein